MTVAHICGTAAGGTQVSAMLQVTKGNILIVFSIMSFFYWVFGLECGILVLTFWFCQRFPYHNEGFVPIYYDLLEIIQTQNSHDFEVCPSRQPASEFIMPPYLRTLQNELTQTSVMFVFLNMNESHLRNSTWFSHNTSSVEGWTNMSFWGKMLRLKRNVIAIV